MRRRHVSLMVMAVVVGAGLSMGPGPAGAQLRPGATTFKPRIIVAPPRLEIAQFSKEFETWGSEMTVNQPQRVRLRWTNLKPTSTSAQWRAWDRDPSKEYLRSRPRLLGQGAAGTASAGKLAAFYLYLGSYGWFPDQPPSQAQSYWVDVIYSGDSGAPSKPVRIVYRRPASTITRFGANLGQLTDADKDGLADQTEYQLAHQFRPVFIFDLDEGAREANEPVMLFQVQRKGSSSVLIKYVALFAWDGGYGPSSDCPGDTHNGDNVQLRVTLRTDGDAICQRSARPCAPVAGKSWEIVDIENWKFHYPPHRDDPYRAAVAFWPDELRRRTHPVIYLSAHKHHPYFDTSRDEEDSVYSFGIDLPPPLGISPCNDDVNGKGKRVWADLLWPDKKPNNVGEVGARLIGDLGLYGYRGENAWSGAPFRGGRGGDDDGTDLLSIWTQ